MGIMAKVISVLKIAAVPIIATILLIIGIVLLSLYNGNIHIKMFDYTECENSSHDKCSNSKTKCICFKNFHLTEPIYGTAALFYELDTYDVHSDNYLQSKDDRQLAGDLSHPPSANCGDYAYVDTDTRRKPIAPCGKIADSMFNDTYILYYNKTEMPAIYTGLEGITAEDRQKHRNPPGDLKIAFQNYSKPKSWLYDVWDRNNVWEPYDDENTTNHALQNEAFIAWMKTDMKRKPAWRVNHTGRFEKGLPVGSYVIMVKYVYPFSVYNGTRQIFLKIQSEPNVAMLVFGIILIILSIGVIVAWLIYNKKKHGTYVPCETDVKN